MVETSTPESFYENKLNEKTENDCSLLQGELFEPSDFIVKSILSYSKVLEVKIINDELSISHVLN